MAGAPAVLWDLDGTLTNPFEGITRSMQFALGELGYEAPPVDELKRYIGPPLQVTFPQLLKSNDSNLADEALRLYRHRYAETGMFENKLIEGIPETLEAVRASGARLYVATSKLESYAIRIVDHFDLTQFFKTVHGSQLDGSRADKGALIRHIVEAEKLDPRRTIMIGDRLHDVHGAAKNDIPAIGVLWGFGDRAELEEAGAAAIARSPSDLPAMVSQISEKLAG